VIYIYRERDRECEAVNGCRKVRCKKWCAWESGERRVNTGVTLEL
jgi:hypothetical protein